MKESGQVSLYIAYFRILITRIQDWGERSNINVYRGGLESRLLNYFASHPGSIDSLKELMDITLELDTRYHERQKEKGGIQEKKPPVTRSNALSPHQDPYSKKPHHRKSKKGKNYQCFKHKPHVALLKKKNK
ncbi:hypothetical protein O181_065995 [Austropuccinia psidii MF-1]|uniref:Uncharacterized protein n=1 Tax=Austropuccinia psidii MF-1 TaxID=1389203 RepID=A0A9Q3EW76_9BASI|nr:hypothetical protein [Austropuccinia psidii MF-1]